MLEFQPSGPAVWSDVMENQYILGKKTKFKIKLDAEKYFDDNPIDYKKELQQVKDFQLDKSKTCSPLWENWAANHSVKNVIDFDYSSTLEAQLKGARDKQKTIRDHNEVGFVGALMCCDTPGRTVAFLFSQLAEEKDIHFGRSQADEAELRRYVAVMLEICFIYKWTGKIARPSQYEYSVNPKQKKTVSLIPHPDHPTAPEGHGTVGFAVLKWAEHKYGSVSKAFARACAEVGEARISCGIHFWYDQLLAKRNVDKYHGVAVGNLI